MARTRTAIKTLIESHTGRKKEALENLLCDSALKVAVMRHWFKDAQSVPSDIEITEDATEIDISGVSGLRSVLTARIVDADGPRNKILKLKTRSWWDQNVINPEDNQKGWPSYGMRVGDTIVIDCPSMSGLELRLRVTTDQIFASDSTECPIGVLDIFVEHYVTAMIFKSIENDEMYKHWIASAMGLRYLVDGTVGGALADAIAADEDPALDIKMEAADGAVGRNGVSVENLIEGHSRYGYSDWWT